MLIEIQYLQQEHNGIIQEHGRNFTLYILIKNINQYYLDPRVENKVIISEII